VQWGLNLTDACMTTYSTPTGLGPGAWAFTATDGGGGSPPAAQAAFAKQHGFWITDSSYYVRPEVFEVSLFLYHLWKAF
jgi:mannosyl-oligosaccharide alpha-1,2-mannosidase